MAMATASDVEDQRSEQELLGSAPSRVSRMRWAGLGLAACDVCGGHAGWP